MSIQRTARTAIGSLLLVVLTFGPLLRAAEPITHISHIPREAITSTALAAVGYSKRLHILEIEFLNGGLYRYLNVPPSIYGELMAAESKARYYDANIKGSYRCFRLRSAKTAVSN